MAVAYRTPARFPGHEASRVGMRAKMRKQQTKRGEQSGIPRLLCWQLLPFPDKLMHVLRAMVKSPYIKPGSHGLTFTLEVLYFRPWLICPCGPLLTEDPPQWRGEVRSSLCYPSKTLMGSSDDLASSQHHRRLHSTHTQRANLALDLGILRIVVKLLSLLLSCQA